MRRYSMMLIWMLILFPFARVGAQAPADAGALLPRVGVLPPINLTEESQYDAVRLSIHDTVLLTLRLTGEYEVVSLEPPVSELTEDVVLSLALEHNLANIVFGRLLRENGDLIIEMEVFDTLQETTVYTGREVPADLFQIFDAADSAVARLVEEFSGVPVGFGTLELRNIGETGRYAVFLDDTDLGENFQVLDRALMGERTLEIRQDRMFGEFILFNETITVEPDRRTVVEFEIPYLLDEERDALDGLEQAIDAEIDRRRSERRVESLFDQAEQLLSVTGYSPAPERESLRFSERRTAWNDGLELWRRRMSPTWIFPTGIGWDLDHDRDPYVNFALARGLGERWYLGVQLHSFLQNLQPYPILYGAYGAEPRRFLVTGGILVLPPGVANESDWFLVPQLGVAVERYLVSAYSAFSLNKLEIASLGLGLGFVF